MPRRATLTRAACFAAVCLSSAGAVFAGSEVELAASPLRLWYDQPAAEWIEALPVGNGRLGAMVFGGITLERLQLNEDTLWAGGPYNPANPAAKSVLPEIRRLLAAGEYAAAQALVDQSFMSVPLRQMPYQAMGDLLISRPASETAFDYERELDLDTAVARTRFTIGGVENLREVFASPVDEVLVIRLSVRNVTQPAYGGRLRFSLAFQSPLAATSRSIGDDSLVLEGRNGSANGVAGALEFETRVKVLVEGDGATVSGTGQQLQVAGAEAAVILLSAATSYRRYDDVSGDPAAINVARLDKAATRDYAALYEDHVAEHRRLFRRVALDLGTSDAAKLPTSERIRRYAAGNDPALATLYFQYGRYLLISSSRPGTQPANLQGLWNDSTDPPWGSKYTININTEMNYWPAEPTALPELTEPLQRLLGELADTGARFARAHYGTGGWVTHHNTDLWRAAGPVDGAFWGMWPMGGAWLATHLWEHYLYGGDSDFLARAYPVLKGASQFFLENLVALEDGTLVTSPSVSPENAHIRRLDRARPRDGQPDPARPVRADGRSGESPRAGRGFREGRALGTRETCGGPHRRPRSAAGMARGLGRKRAGTGSPARIAPLCRASIGADHTARNACTGERRAEDARSARRQNDRLGDRLAHQPVGAAARRRPCVLHPRTAAEPGPQLPEPVRRAPAVPDRRELRRHRGDRRNAVAESCAPVGR